MASLKSFFASNAKKVENVKYVASTRFVDEKGNPEEWELRALTANEDTAIRNACTKNVPTAIKGQTKKDLDADLYMAKMVVASVVYPDLKNSELQDSYGVMGEVELLRTMLLGGELQDLMMKVQEVNGYQKSMDELVEEAKN